MRLNLGCSDQLLEGYVNVDRVPPADEIVDLSTGKDVKWVGTIRVEDARSIHWPWPESSVDEIRAHDIFEHLPDKVRTMNEAWRVLKPGGKLDLFVPTTDGRGAFQDPTHVSFWTPNDIFYFSDRFAEWQRFRVAYGITANFTVLEQSHMLYGPREDNVWKWRAVLEAVKP